MKIKIETDEFDGINEQGINNFLQRANRKKYKEDDEQCRLRFVKKPKKWEFTDMDYKIISIYNSPLPSMKAGKKEINL